MVGWVDMYVKVGDLEMGDRYDLLHLRNFQNLLGGVMID